MQNPGLAFSSMGLGGLGRGTGVMDDISIVVRSDRFDHSHTSHIKYEDNFFFFLQRLNKEMLQVLEDILACNYHRLAFNRADFF